MTFLITILVLIIAFIVVILGEKAKQKEKESLTKNCETMSKESPKEIGIHIMNSGQKKLHVEKTLKQNMMNENMLHRK